MKKKCDELMKTKHHRDMGGDIPTSRRAVPNLTQKFKRGGRAAGGQMAAEDKLKAVGTYSARGSEMNKENMRRASGGATRKKCYDTGGDIGTNTGSSIAREPGSNALKKGGSAMRRAMGGAGKTRKDYPNT